MIPTIFAIVLCQADALSFRGQPSLLQPQNSSEKEKGDLKVLEDMENKMMHMAKSGNAATPSLKVFVDQLIPSLGLMEKAIRDEHKSEQTSLNNLIKPFEDCTHAKATALSDANKILTSQKALSQTHKKCRDTESDAAKKSADCLAIESSLLEVRNAHCDAFKKFPKTPQLSLVPSPIPNEKYRPWLERVKTWVLDELDKFDKSKENCEKNQKLYDERKKICDGLKQNYSDQKSTCDKKQAALETTSCSYTTKVEDTCSQYDTCYAGAQKAYSAGITTIQETQANFEFQYEVVKRIMCLCGLFSSSTNTDLKEADVEGCKKKTHDVSDFKLVAPDEPIGAIQCPPVADKKPCTNQYLSTEYGSLPSNAKAATCQACFTGKCPRRSGWTYLLDYTDERGVDDIPDTVQNVATGFTTKNAFYIGNGELEKLDMNKVKDLTVCFASSSAIDSFGNCNEACEKLTTSSYSDGGTGCEFPDVTNKVKKVVAGLSGQCLSKGIFYKPAVHQGPKFKDEHANKHWMANQDEQAAASHSLKGLQFVGKPNDINILGGLSYSGKSGGGSSGMTGSIRVATSGTTYWEHTIDKYGGHSKTRCPIAIGIAARADGSGSRLAWYGYHGNFNHFSRSMTCTGATQFMNDGEVISTKYFADEGKLVYYKNCNPVYSCSVAKQAWYPYFSHANDGTYSCKNTVNVGASAYTCPQLAQPGPLQESHFSGALEYGPSKGAGFTGSGFGPTLFIKGGVNPVSDTVQKQGDAELAFLDHAQHGTLDVDTIQIMYKA